MPVLSGVLVSIIFLAVIMLAVLQYFAPANLSKAGRPSYYMIFSAGIIFIFLTSLEAVLIVYLMKFYIYYGSNAFYLYIVIFLILISPFIKSIYNYINVLVSTFRMPARVMIQKSGYGQIVKLPKNERQVTKYIPPKEKDAADKYTHISKSAEDKSSNIITEEFNELPDKKADITEKSKEIEVTDNSTESKQTETKTSETKPIETKPSAKQTTKQTVKQTSNQGQKKPLQKTPVKKNTKTKGKRNAKR